MTVIFVALSAWLLFLLQKYLYLKYWDKDIKVTISFDKEEVTEGEENALLEIIENRKWMPLATLKVKFQCSRHLQFRGGKGSVVTDRYYRSDFFSVMPYQRITRTLKMNCPKRGYYDIHGIDLVAADLFFSQEMHAHYDAGDAFYVYPKPFGVKFLEHALQKINGEIAVKRHVVEDPFSFRGIREYETFDEMKSINWKATARTGDLKVNMKEYTSVKSVRVFLNLADNNILRREELLEMSISICATLIKHMLDNGIRTSLYANATDAISGQILAMENNTGRGNLIGVLRALSRLNLEKTENFEETFGEKLLERNDKYTIIISPERHEDFQRLLLKQKDKDNFCFICPVKEMEEERILPELRANCSMILEEQG